MKHIKACLIVALIGIISTSIRADNHLANSPLNIGVIAAFSGDLAGYSESLKNGIEMGLEELSPEIKDGMKFHFEDDSFIPRNTITAFQKLNGIISLDAVVSFSSGTSNALVGHTERSEITLIALASDFKVCKDKKYAFNFFATPDTEAELAFREARRRGYKRIARISATSDFSFAIRDSFDAFNKGEIEILLDEDYPMDVKDFKTYLSKLRRIKDIDAVFINLLPGQIGIFAKQARELKIVAPFFNVEFFEDNNEVKISNGALLGQWYINSDEAESGFLKRYKEKYPKSSPYLAAHGYDLVRHFSRIYALGLRGNETSRYFRGIRNFQGALGTYSATADNRFTLPATVKVVRPDGFLKSSL